MTITRGSFLRVMIPVIAILLIPLIAMRLTSEVNWELRDFIVMGVLVFILGVIVEFARLQWKNKKYLWWIITVAIAAGVFLWMELAVGIIESSITGS